MRGKGEMGPAADLAAISRTTRRVRRCTWSPALTAKELYLKGSNSGTICVQASFSSPGSVESSRSQLAPAAAGLIALYGAMAMHEAKLLSTTLAIFLSLLAVHELLRARGGRAGWRLIGPGLMLGLACTARPNTLLFCPLAAAWWIFDARDQQHDGHEPGAEVAEETTGRNQPDLDLSRQLLDIRTVEVDRVDRQVEDDDERGSQQQPARQVALRVLELTRHVRGCVPARVAEHHEDERRSQRRISPDVSELGIGL